MLSFSGIIMMTFSNRTISKLRVASKREFINRAHQHFLSIYPSDVEIADPDCFNSLLNDSETIANEHGLYSERSVIFVTHIVKVLTHEFASRVESQVISQILKCDGVPEGERVAAALSLANILSSDQRHGSSDAF